MNRRELSFKYLRPSGVALVAAVCAWSTVSLADDIPQQHSQSNSADITVGFGYAAPLVSHDSPVSYDPSWNLNVGLDARVSSWLTAEAYLARSRHDIRLPHDYLRAVDDDGEPPTLLNYSIGFQFRPNWRVTRRLEVFALLGIGWGKLSVERIYVEEADAKFPVDKRTGVFVETPFGMGMSYEVIPSWLKLVGQFSFSPRFKQSGKLHGTVSTITEAGSFKTVEAWSTVEGMSSVWFGTSLVL